MRIYFILAVVCFSSLAVFSQKLELAKASPFSAVQWEKEQPIVLIENDWYHFEKLADFSKEEILAYCKKKFGYKWKKRFSEDLVEVLIGLGYQPAINVRLQLSKEGVYEEIIGTFTSENRQSSLDYNNALEESKSDKTFPQKISISEALADIKQFEAILKSRSSYAQVSTYDYTAAIHNLAAAIRSTTIEIDVNKLTNELAKIMAEIGDRHSSIKNEAFDTQSHKTHTLKLPFGVTTLDGKMIAVTQDAAAKSYSYYADSHPYLKSIDGVVVETLISNYNFRDKKAPTQAKLSKGSSAIQKYGELLFKNNTECPDSVTVVFSDGTSVKTETVQLTTVNKGYYSKLFQDSNTTQKEVENGNFAGLSSLLDQNIGYITFPQMYHYNEAEGLEAFIANTFRRFSATKALIIDIRNNPGGGRELLQTVANYIVQPEQSPWIANVAYLRTDALITSDEVSMSGRYLYSYHSDNFTDTDRHAIDAFTSNFTLQKSLDTSNFSNPFYMVLHDGSKPYKQPVYILVNENSFSAATVFTSAFKGLPNVKIVGVTTDGSSGNSRALYLEHSNIRVKVSTMLSFQRNGTTLDGNGTAPDIYIPVDEVQVLKGVDSQLNKLIKRIASN